MREWVPVFLLWAVLVVGGMAQDEAREKQEGAVVEEKVVDESRLTAFLGESHVPIRNYTAAWLDQYVKEAAALAAAFPEQSEVIRQHVAPWVEELQKLRRGHVKRQGKWFTPGEWIAFQDAAEKKLWDDFFQEGPIYEIDGEVIPAETAKIMLGLILSSVIILLVLIVQALGALRQGFSIFPILSILFSVGILGWYGWMGQRMLIVPETSLSRVVEEKGAAENNGLQMVLYHATRDPDDGGPSSPRSIVIMPGEVNWFMDKHFKIKKPAEEDFFTFYREKITLAGDGDDWIIHDSGNWLGRPMVFTYRLTFYGSNYKVTGRLGNAPLPGRAVESAWRVLDAELRRVLKESRVLEGYSVTKMGPKGIEFTQNKD